MSFQVDRAQSLVTIQFHNAKRKKSMERARVVKDVGVYNTLMHGWAKQVFGLKNDTFSKCMP